MLESGNLIDTSYYIKLTKAAIRWEFNSASFFRLHGINIMAAAHNEIFTKTIEAPLIDTVKKCVDKPGT